MNLHALQHSPKNTLGTIEEYARTKNHPLHSTRFYEIESPPAFDTFDLLIIMGGPMGTCDYAENPWLKDEKIFIKQSIDAGKPVLGICLGAQLLADVLGARVYETKQKEMGWFPIRASPAGKMTGFMDGLPEEIVVFHWHSRTFDLPSGALRLYESDKCRNQAFIYGDRVVALQFHPEATDERIGSMIKMFGGEPGGKMDSALWSSYFNYIESSSENEAGVSLHVPSDYTGTGNKQGTITFWAEAA